MWSSASLCTQDKVCADCKRLGWSWLCPVLYCLHQANPITEDVVSWVPKSWWLLAVFHRAGNVSITLIWSLALLSAKCSWSRSSLPRQTCLSPLETSNLISPSHSSLLHILLNPKKSGYVHVFTGKNKTCLKRGSKHLLFQQRGPHWQQA